MLSILPKDISAENLSSFETIPKLVPKLELELINARILQAAVFDDHVLILAELYADDIDGRMLVSSVALQHLCLTTGKISEITTWHKRDGQPLLKLLELQSDPKQRVLIQKDKELYKYAADRRTLFKIADIPDGYRCIRGFQIDNLNNQSIIELRRSHLPSLHTFAIFDWADNRLRIVNEEISNNVLEGLSSFQFVRFGSKNNVIVKSHVDFHLEPTYFIWNLTDNAWKKTKVQDSLVKKPRDAAGWLPAIVSPILNKHNHHFIRGFNTSGLTIVEAAKSTLNESYSSLMAFSKDQTTIAATYTPLAKNQRSLFGLLAADSNASVVIWCLVTTQPNSINSKISIFYNIASTVSGETAF